MKVIVCLDDNKGMMFNNRRVSKDRQVIESIYQLLNGDVLCMNSYSYKMFEEEEMTIVVCDDFLKMSDVDFYFVEDNGLSMFQNKIDEIVVYWWNRAYPSDLKLSIDLSEYTLVDSEEFSGTSHEKITKEIYKKVG